MRILVTGDDDDTRRKVAAALQHAGHTVRAAQDVTLALQQDSPQLVLVTTHEASTAALALVRQIRGSARLAAAHIVLMAPAISEAFSIDAYGAGLDSEILLPHGAEYLLARVGALQRRIEPNAKPRVASANGGAPKAAAPAASALDPSSPVSLVSRTSAWRLASENLKVAASKFLTLEASVGDAPAASFQLSIACGILLVNAEHQLELRVAVGADAGSAKHLAVHLFGPEGEDLMADMLGEIANIFMGGLKTAFSTDSLAFTGGLPAAIATDLVLRPATTYKLQEAFSVMLVDARLVVHLGLRSKANLLLPPAGLKEGMVVAKDIFNPKGLLMVNAGTRLSTNMVDKLRGILAPKHAIEVTAS